VLVDHPATVPSSAKKAKGIMTDTTVADTA
jgi:hypothetical protein